MQHLHKLLTRPVFHRTLIRKKRLDNKKVENKEGKKNEVQLIFSRYTILQCQIN